MRRITRNIVVALFVAFILASCQPGPQITDRIAPSYCMYGDWVPVRLSGIADGRFYDKALRIDGSDILIADSMPSSEWLSLDALVRSGKLTIDTQIDEYETYRLIFAGEPYEYTFNMYSNLEYPEDDEMPYMDISVKNTETGMISTSVYQKLSEE